MSPNDDRAGRPDGSGSGAKKPYAPPQVIFSELFPRGVKKTASTGTTEYHSMSSASTS